MASIVKRGNYQFQVQVRRKGFPAQQKTFETRRAAEAWAAVIESEMVRGTFVDRTELERTTLDDILARYEREVTPTKRGWRAEANRLKLLRQRPMAARPLAALRGADFATYRDQRLTEVGPKTVRLELGALSAVLNTARMEWDLPVANFVTNIRKPAIPPGRERRVEPGEEEKLLAAAADSKAPQLRLCIVLALETGMRRGEIADLTWERIDLPKHAIRLDQTKNGERRTVPLSAHAEAELRALPRPLHGGKVFTFFDSNGLGAAFRRACARAGIESLRFHDLRHEAASRLAPKMTVATLAKVMGWRTLQMALRYYNPTPAELVAAIRKAA